MFFKVYKLQTKYGSAIALKSYSLGKFEVTSNDIANIFVQSNIGRHSNFVVTINTWTGNVSDMTH